MIMTLIRRHRQPIMFAVGRFIIGPALIRACEWIDARRFPERTLVLHHDDPPQFNITKPERRPIGEVFRSGGLSLVTDAPPRDAGHEYPPRPASVFRNPRPEEN